MTSGREFAERFARQVRTRDIERVSAGSPYTLSLSFREGASTPEAARILAKRHVSLKDAHTALTKMLDHGEACVTVPCVEDLKTLQAELVEAGVFSA